MTVNPIPEGYHSVTPYLVVEGAAGLIDFLKQAFGATEKERFLRPDGLIGHAEVKIGDSIVMLSDAGEQGKPMHTGIHLYVEDADAVYRRALQAGATSLSEPGDQFYGDRSAGVQDPRGNTWWISTHFEDLTPEEIVERGKGAFAQPSPH